jgi:hypothetical protein
MGGSERTVSEGGAPTTTASRAFDSQSLAVETLARQIDETHAHWDQLEAWPTPSQPRPPST